MKNDSKQELVVFIGNTPSKFVQEFVRQGYEVVSYALKDDWRAELIALAKTRRLIVQSRTDRILEAILIENLPLKYPNIVCPNATYMQVANKRIVREFFSDHLSARSVKFKNITHLSADVITDLFPLKKERRYIAKPVNGGHSSFVRNINSPEELIEYFKLVRKEISADILIEEFIPGQQYSLDSYITQTGEVIHTPICKQHIENNVTSFSGYPSDLDESMEAEIQSQFTEIYSTMRLRAIVIHSEFRLSQDAGVKIIELNPRTGGYRSDMLEISYGIDHFRNFVNIFSAGEIKVSNSFLEHSICPQFWSEQEGTLTNIAGLEEMQHLESYRNHYILQKPGKIVGPASAGYQRCLTVILANANKKKMLEELKRLRSLINIIVA